MGDDERDGERRRVTPLGEDTFRAVISDLKDGTARGFSDVRQVIDDVRAHTEASFVRIHRTVDEIKADVKANAVTGHETQTCVAKLEGWREGKREGEGVAPVVGRINGRKRDAAIGGAVAMVIGLLELARHWMVE